MKTYTNLNANEISVLNAVSTSSDANGGDFTYFNDVIKESNEMTEQQVKGYISQLSQKKYISVEKNSSNPMITSGHFVDFLTEYKF